MEKFVFEIKDDRVEIIARNEEEAVGEANKLLANYDDRFYAWMDAGRNKRKAMWGVWD